MKKITRVVCGMSGGVDSSVAALLLKRKDRNDPDFVVIKQTDTFRGFDEFNKLPMSPGFDVVGAFMRNWESVDEVGECTLDQDNADALEVCRQIGIPLVETNFVKQYWNYVFSDTLDDYECGYTPNPDVLCNQFIKFGAFYRHCRERLGADAIATGHYVRTDFGPYLENYRESSVVRMFQGSDVLKDQSFFLSRVDQEALRHCCFPLGHMQKTEVRHIARINRLAVANKPDSMGICFIGRRKFQTFIDQYLERRPGNFVDIDTDQVVGTHNGIHQWTIGQRCNIAGYNKPYYVARKNCATQTIYVASGTHHPSLYSNKMTVGNPHWISGDAPENLMREKQVDCSFRFQHMWPVVRCRIQQMSNNNFQVILLDGPTRALTPGQYAVFYNGEECLGSARIQTVDPMSPLDPSPT